MDLALYAVICSRVDVVSPLRSFATCYCGLVSPTNERSRLSYKHHILSYPLACVHYRCATFIRLVVGYNLYFILVISRIVRLPALLRVLRTLNSAPSRTIQARTIEGTPLYIYLHVILYFLCAISKGPYDCTDR